METKKLDWNESQTLGVKLRKRGVYGCIKRQCRKCGVIGTIYGCEKCRRNKLEENLNRYKIRKVKCIPSADKNIKSVPDCGPCRHVSPVTCTTGGDKRQCSRCSVVGFHPVCERCNRTKM